MWGVYAEKEGERPDDGDFFILVIFWLGGFSGRFDGDGYGYGHGGIGVVGIILIVLLVFVLTGRL
jgi:hypothetical protein